MTNKKSGKDKKIEELENNWKRALADYKNLQTRFNEDKKQIGFLANEILITNLLPILDSMEKGNEITKDEGLMSTYKEFKKVLETAGLKGISSDNKSFDPNQMEAIETVSGKKNQVIKTVRKGYLLNGKLIRPARVCVGLGKMENK